MRTLIKRFRRECAYILILTVVWFFRLLPRGAALRVGSMIGSMVPYAARKEYRLAVEHLTIAFGNEKSTQEIRELAREVFRSLVSNFVDTIRLKVMTQEEIINVCIPHNKDRFFEVYNKGKGIIAMSGHVGCWEMMGSYLAAIGIKTEAIAKKLYDPRIEQLLFDSRVSGGMKVLSRGENTRDIIRALRKGHLVGMLIDQDTKIRGEFVEFFGKPAYTATGPALLSLRYGIPIVPLFTCRDKNHKHHIYMGDAVAIEPTGDMERDISELTVLLSKVTEYFIREHPEQWVWFHRRWKTQPENRTAEKGKETHEKVDS